MRYNFSAKTRDGLQKKSGQIDAPNQKTAITQLRENNLIVYSLIPVSERFNPLNFLHNIRGITLNDKVEFTQQIASMISAGLPLPKALAILSQQSKNPKMGSIVQNIMSEVESGNPLSGALEKQGETFSRSYVSLIRAGEASGKLDEVMNRLAITLEKQRQFRTKVQGAMVYPMIISIAMVLVFALVVLFVVPKMTSIYESFQVELPMMTKMMISFSEFLSEKWWVMILMIVGFVVGFKAFVKTPTGAKVYYKTLFKVPIIGALLINAEVVEFSRTLGLLVDAGVPIVEGLEIVHNTVGTVIFKDSVNRLIDDVKHGYPLSQTVAKEEYFPLLVPQMLSVGEETGTVGDRLKSLSEFYEAEVDKVVKNLSTAIEPLIMIVLGGMVGLLIISVILPIYKITSSF